MASPQLPRRYRWYGLGLLVVLVGLVAWNAWPRWSTTRITSVTVDGAHLGIFGEACGSHRVGVEEQVDQVTITVEVKVEQNVDCAGAELPVTLDEPLGDRALVDGSDDHELTCQPAGAEQQECRR